MTDQPQTSLISTSQTLRLERTNTVATLSIISKMGSMGMAFWQEFPQALSELLKLNEAGEIRVLVLRGEQVFSAGLDIKDNAAAIVPALGNEAAFGAIVDQMHAVTEGLAALPIPVIAAVHGWCIGAGLELIAGADIRLCSQETRFSLPEVKLGITADLGGLQRLPQLIGKGRTAYLALSADTIDAGTAERWGLVTEILDTPEHLFKRAEQLAQQLASLPAPALEGTKRILNDGLPHAESLSAAVRWNAQHMSLETLTQGALAAQSKPTRSQ